MKLYIIGAGTMGSAIAAALKKNHPNHELVMADRNRHRAQTVAKKSHATVDEKLSSLSKADVIIIAVKPHDIAGLAEGASGLIKNNALLISIAAGIPIKKIQRLFRHQKVVRVMPNLGLSVGHGIAVWKAAGSLTKIDKQKAERLLDKITENYEVKSERLIDAVTAVSGSGPAYFFYLAKSIEKAARELGIGEKISRKLVEKTFLGSAFLQQGQEYSKLIKQIASKKGTTEAALRVFRNKNMDKIINTAIKNAWQRAKELSHD